MKLLSISILVAALIISFHFVWINRIEIKRADEWSFVIFNKWNGNHCVFHTAKMGRKNKSVLTQFNNCIVNEYGKINLP